MTTYFSVTKSPDMLTHSTPHRMTFEQKAKMLTNLVTKPAAKGRQSRSRYTPELLQPNVQEVLDEAFIRPRAREPPSSRDRTPWGSQVPPPSSVPQRQETGEFFPASTGGAEFSKYLKRKRSCESCYDASESAIQGNGG